MTTLQEIEQILDAQVRPQLQTHGGGLQSLSFEDGIYRFRFLGRCSGCPAADLTTEEVVEKALCAAFPDVKQAVLVQEVDESLLEQARLILRSHGG